MYEIRTCSYSKVKISLCYCYLLNFFDAIYLDFKADFYVFIITFRTAKYREPEFWKFGEEGNEYFRHATGQIYAISKDLATYISNNQ